MYHERKQDSCRIAEEEIVAGKNFNAVDLMEYFGKNILRNHDAYFSRIVTDIDDDEGLKFLDLKEKVERLLDSPRNSKIKQRLDFKAFCVKEDQKIIYYSGLRERLKKNWWSNTEENPIKRNRQEMKLRSTSKFYSSKKKTFGCNSFGAVHGSQVHKQMELFTLSFMMKNGKRWLFENVKTPDVCTLRIIRLLDKEKWIPIASEFKIWEEDWRVATAVDMIVIDTKTNELVILEFKCGYEGEEYGAHPTDEYLPEPFQMLPNCPLVRHTFQLLGMKRILERKYNVKVDQAYIIRLCPKMRTVEKIGLCNWCTDEDNIYNLDYGMMVTR